MLAVAMTLSFVLPGYMNTSYAASTSAIRNEVKKVTVSGRSFTVQTISIPKGVPTTVGLAKGKVGLTQDFNAIVKAYRGEAAINGAFFEAYGGPPDPYGNLIVDGKIVHMGHYGTTIGFKADGTALMDRLRLSLKGTVSRTVGSPLSWYATFVNRTPSTNANVSILYTEKRGSNVGFKGGIAVVMENGKVTKKVPNDNVMIPKNGYVLVCNGTEKSMAERFEVGADVEMNVTYQDDQGQALPWEEVITAVGAGPRLVKEGKVALTPTAEGFKDQKILSSAAARSGIAIMADGSVMIATISGATMKQWAEVMQKLGAKQAMNLDGGASSALYGRGKVLTSAGRLLSNTLVFGNNLNRNP
ncbi:copper amine oxidase [Paenibacillus macquariensis subsp. defensor]|nr:copper amine oxidase [Paenibacillus macquariensis subsp. defensor]